MLSANVNFGAGSVLARTNAEGVVNKSIVVQRGGQDVGIVGLTNRGQDQYGFTWQVGAQLSICTLASIAECVNDFAAPGVMNLLCRGAVVGRCWSSPLGAG